MKIIAKSILLFVCAAASSAAVDTSSKNWLKRRLGKPICGDNIISGKEECDPPDAPDYLTCDANCKLVVPSTVCGNGNVESGEECDDGNLIDGDGCSASCTIEGGGGGPGVCSVTSGVACNSSADCPSYCSKSPETTCLGNSDCDGNGNKCKSDQVCEVASSCLPPYDTARDPNNQASESELLAAITALSGHVSIPYLEATYNPTQIDADRAKFVSNSARLTSSDAVMEAALDLIDQFEASSYGPLFSSDKDLTTGTTNFNGIPRQYLNGDKFELERAILAVQQAVLDEVYHGSLWHPIHRSDPVDRAYSPIVEACSTKLASRKWLTSTYFPGAVDPPADPTIVHTVNVNAKFALRWGRRVAFSDTYDSGNYRAIRPIGGLYLAPGEVAVVTVPTALVDSGYTIQVGGNMIDNFNKGTHLRMDRITTTFPIEGSMTTHIANPVGGGLYLRIPYDSPQGVENVQIEVTGGVVKSPRFALTSLETTTEAEWNAARTEPGQWVDFESDTFLMTVPRVWVWDMAYSHVNTLLTNYSNWMEGITNLIGVPVNKTNNYVAFNSADRHIRYGGYGIGYPQVNNLAPAKENGPVLSGFGGVDGAANYWMVVNPILDDVFYHELGHQIFGGSQSSMYRGEAESIVHVAYTYARNEIYGDDIDTAFSSSISVKEQCDYTDPGHNPRTGCQVYTNTINSRRLPRMSVDDAAIDWIVRENFRDSSVMDFSGTQSDEIKYQHRGHAKYADIARLFGWQVISDFYLQESLDIESNASPVCALASNADDRTFRLSLKAGVDLTPLIHFWGIPPDNEQALRDCINQNALLPSAVVRSQLERYATIIPADQTEFIQHFNNIWPGKFDATNSPGEGCPDIRYGCGWYNEWHPKWNETLAVDAVSAVQAIITKYWGSRRMRGQSSQVHPTSRELGLFGPTEVTRNKANLDGALGLWKSKSKQSYNFELEYEWYAPDYQRGPFLVEIKNGVVVSAKEKESGSAVDKSYVEIPTIADLFDLVGSSLSTAQYSSVDYNSQTGAPNSIFLKKSSDDGDESDGDLNVYVRNVEL